MIQGALNALVKVNPKLAIHVVSSYSMLLVTCSPYCTLYLNVEIINFDYYSHLTFIGNYS